LTPLAAFLFERRRAIPSATTPAFATLAAIRRASSFVRRLGGYLSGAL
jgi:hypothetical protein